MTKKVLFLVVSLVFTSMLYAQKPQRIAYIDMEYILESVPDYTQAESQLKTKVAQWQKKIAKKQREIEVLKTDLSNEKALLTKSLIEEREEDIAIKLEELNKLQNKYFGTEGDLYKLRKQLVKPVQDQVYNSIQEIATKRKYDFVLDKSSDLIMLYSNDKYDISDMVIKSITRDERQKDVIEKREERKEKQKAKQDRKNQPNEKAEAKIKEREAKKKEMKEKIAKQKAERKAQREVKKKAAEEARKKKVEERKAAKEKRNAKKIAVKTEEKEVIEKNIKDAETTLEDSESKAVESSENTKIIPKDTETTTELSDKEKRQALLAKKKAEREMKRKERKEKTEAARLKRLELRNKKKKELEEKRKAAQKGNDAEPETEPEQE